MKESEFVEEAYSYPFGLTMAGISSKEQKLPPYDFLVHNLELILAFDVY